MTDLYTISFDDFIQRIEAMSDAEFECLYNQEVIGTVREALTTGKGLKMHPRRAAISTQRALRSVPSRSAPGYKDRIAELKSRDAEGTTSKTKPAPVSVAAPKPSASNSSQGDAAIAEIQRIKGGKAGPQRVTILTVTPAQIESRINHVLNQSTKGESMSNQPKPEPPVTVIAEKARDYQKQQHAKGNRFYSIAEAVNHVRQEMGLSNDTLATDADMTRRANAQE